MNINRPSISKKIIIIVIVCLLTLALIVVGGWSFVAIQAEADFSSGISKLRQQLKADLEKGSKDIKTASEKHDTVSMSQSLESLSNNLISDTQAAPEPWQLLGLSFVSQNRVDDKKSLLSKVDALTSALKSASDILEYENQVIEPLLSVKNLSGKTLKEQQSLAAAWLAMLDKLKKMTPPDVATQLHASIIKVVSDAQTILAAIPPLYEKKDQTGFAAKNAELQVVISKLQSLHEVVQKLDAATDKSVGEAYTALSKNVE